MGIQMTFRAMRCQRRRCGATYGCGAGTRRHGGQGMALLPYTSRGYPGRCCLEFTAILVVCWLEAWVVVMSV